MKKRNPNKTFIIDLAVYPFDVMVSTEPIEKVIKEISKAYDLSDEEKKQLEMSETHLGRCLQLRGGQTVIRLKHPPYNPKQIASMAHEAFHAACFLLERIGVKYSDNSDEAFAYLIEYLIEKILLGFAK